MSGRYDDVVVGRHAPFVTGDAHVLILELVPLRHRFAEAGMWQTYHALEAGVMKAGFERADHIRLVLEDRVRRKEQERLNRIADEVRDMSE